MVASLRLSTCSAKRRTALRPSGDSTFDLLYPPAGSAPEAGPAATAELATAWAARPPLEVAEQLAAWQREAESAGRPEGRASRALGPALAAAVERPEAWLDAFLARGLYDRVAPFLEEDVARRREGWERRLASALTLDPLAEAAAARVLSLADPPPDLLAQALEEAARTPLLAERLARERAVPLPALAALLASRRWQTALAAALGEWMAPPVGTVRPELAAGFREAVLRARTAEYEETPETVGLQHGLRLLLGRDPELAAAWLEARLADPDLPVYFSAESPFARAIAGLDRAARSRLLGSLREAPILQSLLPHLIGGDAELFRQLLRLPTLAAYHLAPLRRAPAAVWEELATAALDAGHAPREVAEASLFRPAGGAGDRWAQRDRAFAALAHHPRRDLREVGRHGRQRVREEIRRERAVSQR
jgi:hypothetical protein